MKLMSPLLVLFLLISSDLPALGDNPRTPGSVGRYADGRAYRIDSQGLQLADQIAELEMTIREQEKQLIACEERSGGLAAAPAAAPATCEITRASCATFVLPLENRIVSLQQVNAPLQNEVAELRAERQSLLQQVSLSDSERVREKQQKVTLFSQQQTRVSQLEARLAELEIQLKASSGVEEKRLSELKKLLEERERQLAAKTKREAELMANLDNVTKQLATSLEKPVARAMLAPPVAASPPVSSSSRKQLQNELSTIQTLITKRKDLYDSMRNARKGVTTSLQNLETSRRVPLDSLRQRAQSADSNEEVNGVSAGLSEIRAILESDIAVLERLLKRL